MMDPMQVDSDTSKLPPLGPAFTPSQPLPFISGPPKVDDRQRVELNTLMNHFSSLYVWLTVIERAGDGNKDVLANVIVYLTASLPLKADFIAPMSLFDAVELVEKLDADEFKLWWREVKVAVDKGDWAKLASHLAFRKPAEPSAQRLLHDTKAYHEKVFTKAYNKPFVGDTAKNLIEYLKTTENEIKAQERVVYAKAFSVVQSSGTGKSRMLTEAGKFIFTLPICLRGEDDYGYPPPDLEVVEYFNSLSKENDLSHSAHIAVACFIAAAHMTMLHWLKQAKENGMSELHVYWHQLMEPVGEHDGRNLFFSDVIKLATSLKEKHKSLRKGASPKRLMTRIVEDERESHDINEFAETAYKTIVREATNDLMDFLSCIEPDALCVMYFDEAHGLKLCFWVLLHLLNSQDMLTRMWTICMGTKSSLSFYAPRPGKMLSLRMKREMANLLPPYLALGFDQHMIAKFRAEMVVRMGELQTIEHLAQFGRPLWSAQLPEVESQDMIQYSSFKLTNAQNFDASDVNHVFAVLSQRLCLDPVLSGSEAIELSDRSIAHHMRLLTGFSDNGTLFYTHSPSEPILALGSAHILHNMGKPYNLKDSLTTLSTDLCSAGLVEKGTMGELGARTLLLVARDFAAPLQQGNRNFLEPVPLLDFLHSLFGNPKNWAKTHQKNFNTTFGDTHINFTHWIVTKDPLPVEPDLKLLANLWARNAALQCCFTQEAIDFLIPVYHGSVAAGAVFNPSLLSAIVGQVKFKETGDQKAETLIHPFIPRDSHSPLPYLAVLMELGNESSYQSENSKIRTTSPVPLPKEGDFSKRTAHLAAVVQKHALRLEEVPLKKQKDDPELKRLKMEIKNAQLAVDSYNRYSISVRGVSPDVYQILRTANIAREFATLLKITMPPPRNQEALIQHMRPLERLGAVSNHTAWMPEYVAGERIVCD